MLSTAPSSQSGRSGGDGNDSSMALTAPADTVLNTGLSEEPTARSGGLPSGSVNPFIRAVNAGFRSKRVKLDTLGEMFEEHKLEEDVERGSYNRGEMSDAEWKEWKLGRALKKLEKRKKLKGTGTRSPSSTCAEAGDIISKVSDEVTEEEKKGDIDPDASQRFNDAFPGNAGFPTPTAKSREDSEGMFYEIRPLKEDI